MDISQYVTTLLRRLWLILLLTMIAAGSALTVSAVTQPVYAATATVLVNQAPHGDLTDQGALVTGQELARTYVQLLTKRPILVETIANAGIAMSPDELEGSVQVAIVGDTGLITIQVENQDPALAAKLANSIPTIFAQENGARQASRYADLLTNLTKELDGLTKQIAQTKADIDAIPDPPTATELARVQQLQGALFQLQSNYTTLLQTYDSTRLAETQATSNIQVVEPALVPATPVRPKILQDTLLAGAVGLALAVALVFLMEYLDDRIRTPEQVSNALGVPVLGTIGRFKSPAGKQGTQAFISVAEPRSPVVEAFRMLRTNIRSRSVNQPIRSILVTSVAPTEGKSTVSANLAAVMAQTGLKVLLVDADLRRPSVHTLFDRDNDQGLTDLILNRSLDWAHAVQSSSIANLSILPSGPIPDDPSELLESGTFREILENLVGQFELVMIDSAPLLPVTDSAVLAPLVDAVLLVVDVDNTRIGMLRQGKAQLDNINVHLIGTVMNKVPPGHAGYPNYYQYYRDEAKPARGRQSKSGHPNRGKAQEPRAEDAAPESQDSKAGA